MALIQDTTQATLHYKLILHYVYLLKKLASHKWDARYAGRIVHLYAYAYILDNVIVMLYFEPDVATVYIIVIVSGIRPYQVCVGMCGDEYD